MILVNPEKRMVTIKIPGTSERIQINPESQSEPVADKHLRVLRTFIDQFGLRVIKDEEGDDTANDVDTGDGTGTGDDTGADDGTIGTTDTGADDGTGAPDGTNVTGDTTPDPDKDKESTPTKEAAPVARRRNAKAK